MSALRKLIQIVTPSINVLSRRCLVQIPTLNLLCTSGNLPTVIPKASLRTRTLVVKTFSGTTAFPKPFPKVPSHQETVVDRSEEEIRIINDVVSKVNNQIINKSHGRLFAVIHLLNRQWKITAEDVLVLEGFWPPNVGDTIRLEKVLLVGSSDFSLVGRPLLRPDLVNIQATVIEKRLSHTKTHFKKKRRKQYQRINFYRFQQTMIRINSIQLTSQVNEKQDIEGISGRIF